MLVKDDFRLMDCDLLDKAFKTFELGEDVHISPIISASEVASFEAEMTCVNPNLLRELIGYPSNSFSLTFEGMPRLVQVRKHKKKRINKKWAKIYGYKTIIDKMTIKDVAITPNESAFEFIGSTICKCPDILGRC